MRRAGMIDLFFDILTVGGPIVLGVMGATMALWPPSVEGNTRFYWFAAFVLVGVISAIARPAFSKFESYQAALSSL